MRSLVEQYKGLRKELYILFIGRIVTSMGSMVYPMLTMILNQKLGWNASTIAFVILLFGLLQMPMTWLGGKLADSANKRNIIIGFDLLSVVCFLIAAFLPIGFVSVILLGLAGMFQTVENASYDALIADLSLTKDRERAYSLMYLGGNFGMILSPVISGLLFKNHLRLAFAISGFSVGISTLLIWLFVKNIARVEETDAKSVYQQTDDGISTIEILKKAPALCLFLITSQLYWSLYSQHSYLLPLDMARVHGENGAAIYGTVSSLNCIVVVLFTPLLTRFASKRSHPETYLFGEIFSASGYLIFLLFLGHIPFYYLAMFLFTLGEIFCTIVNGPYLTSRIPASHRGRVVSFANILGSVLFSAAELSVGFLYDQKPEYAWYLILGLFMVTFLLNAILRKKDKETYPALYANRDAADG
ncbi:MAG: MFS transporter [Erysipelotrichaceae bacterium]|nr:MFS transporter [Erysipelotrichaceae bacterium]